MPGYTTTRHAPHVPKLPRPAQGAALAISILGIAVWMLGVYLGLWWLGLAGLLLIVVLDVLWGKVWGCVLMLSVSILWTPQVWPFAWPGWAVFTAIAGVIIAALVIARTTTPQRARPRPVRRGLRGVVHPHRW